MPSSTFSNILDFQRSATVANSIQSGIRHLLELALNGNPTNPSINGYIASQGQDSTAPAGNEMTLIVAVRDGATFVSGANGVRSASVDGITYTVEGRSSLACSACPRKSLSTPQGDPAVSRTSGCRLALPHRWLSIAMTRTTSNAARIAKAIFTQLSGCSPAILPV